MSLSAFAQDSTKANEAETCVIVINKYPRLDELAEKEAAFNVNAAKTTSGYRLLLLSTNDRNIAMDLRSKLLQQYPSHKIYMSFQPPYIKVKFGDFVEKDAAEKLKNELLKKKLVIGTIYLVPEIVEVKP
ncbi:MAG: SPOR domain-containing protein [Sphingobacteriales bacterium]|nr:SPOR domain-containing protein [Sphingobacteriales bacterium]